MIEENAFCREKREKRKTRKGNPRLLHAFMKQIRDYTIFL